MSENEISDTMSEEKVPSEGEDDEEKDNESTVEDMNMPSGTINVVNVSLAHVCIIHASRLLFSINTG